MVPALLMLLAGAEPLVLGSPRLRMDATILCAAFSPDGGHLVTAGHSRRVSFWDVRTGEEARHVDTGGFPVHWLRFSPDGRLLYLGGSDGSVRVLDAASAGLKRRLVDPERTWGTPHLDLSPDGRTLVMLHQFERQLLLFDTANGALRHRVKGLAYSQPGQTAFTPDGRHLVTAWTDGRLHLIDVATGRSVRCLEPEAEAAKGGGYGPRAGGMTLIDGGRRLLYRLAEDRPFQVREVATGRLVRTMPRPGVEYTSTQPLDLLPGGRVVAERFGPWGVRLVGVASGRTIRHFAAPGALSASAVSRDGRHLAICAGHAVFIWDIASGRVVTQGVGHLRPPLHLTFTHGGARLVSIGQRRWRVWDAETGRQLSEHDGLPTELKTRPAVSDGGRSLEFVSLSRGRYRWDVGASAVTALTAPRSTPHYTGEAVSPDGRWYAGVRPGTKSLRVMALTGPESDRDVGSVPESHGNVLVFSPDARTLAVGARDQSLTLIDLGTGAETRLAGSGDEEAVGGGNHIVFRHDGRVAARFDGRLRLIEVATGQERLRLPAEVEALSCAPSWSADGRLVALAFGEGVVVHDTLSGREVFRRRTEQGGVRSLAFAPGGHQLATGGQDTTIRVWALLAPAALPRDGTLAEAWEMLRVGTTAEAHRAMARLMAEPGRSVRLVCEGLRPRPPADAKTLARLLAELDDGAYAVRANAEAALAKIGGPAREALKRAAKEGAAEVRSAAGRLLEALDGPAARRREARAVELLELLGAREALRGIVGRARPLAEEALRRLDDAEAAAGIQ